MDTQGIPPTVDDNDNLTADFEQRMTKHNQLKGASERTPSTADDSLAAEITKHNQLKGTTERTPSTADENLAATITKQNQLKGAFERTPSTADENLVAAITKHNQLENKDDTFHKNKIVRSTATFLPVEKWPKRKKIVQPWNRPDNKPNRAWPWFPRSDVDREKAKKRRKWNTEIERGRSFFPRYPKETRIRPEVKKPAGKTKATLRNEQRVNDSNNKDEKQS